MAEGYLDAEHGIELLPPALLTQKPAGSKKRTRALRFYSGVATLGFAAWTLLIPIRAAKVDDTAWRKAVRLGTSAAYLGYVRAMPEGRHVEEAKRLGEEPFEDAIADFRATARADAPLTKALIQAAELLHNAGETQAPFTLKLTNKLPDEVRPEPGPGSPLGLSVTATRSTAVAAQLNRMLANVGLGQVLQLVTIDLWKGKPSAQVELVIEGEARADSAVLVAEGVPELPAPMIEWKVSLVQTGAPQPLWSTTLAVPTPDEIPLPTTSGVSRADWICERTADAAYSALVDKIAQEIGLPGAPPGSQTAGRARRSPYLR
jgi:hypothetical protein